MARKGAAQAEQFKEAFKRLLNMSCDLYMNLRGRPQNRSLKLSNLPSDLPILREEKGSYEAASLSLRLLHSKVPQASPPTRSLPEPMVKSSPGGFPGGAVVETLPEIGRAHV